MWKRILFSAACAAAVWTFCAAGTPAQTPAQPQRVTSDGSAASKLREQTRLAYAKSYALWEWLQAVQTAITEVGDSAQAWGPDVDCDIEQSGMLKVLVDKMGVLPGSVRKSITDALAVAQPDLASNESAVALVKELQAVRVKLNDVDKTDHELYKFIKLRANPKAKLSDAWFDAAIRDAELLVQRTR
jgi:hypothetical protein